MRLVKKRLGFEVSLELSHLQILNQWIPGVRLRAEHEEADSGLVSW